MADSRFLSAFVKDLDYFIEEFFQAGDAIEVYEDSIQECQQLLARESKQPGFIAAYIKRSKQFPKLIERLETVVKEVASLDGFDEV